MKYAQGFMATLVGLIGLLFLAFLVGMRLPQDVTVRRTTTLKTPLADVWAVVSDPAQSVVWHPEGKAYVERTVANGNPVWVETGELAVTYTQVDSTPPRRLSRSTMDDALPFYAEWTIVLVEEGEQTRVTITQKATTKEPIDRVRAAWIDGPSERVDGWLVGLGAHFGQSVSPSSAD